jgi:hypothetical protein
LREAVGRVDRHRFLQFLKRQIESPDVVVNQRELIPCFIPRK